MAKEKLNVEWCDDLDQPGIGVLMKPRWDSNEWQTAAKWIIDNKIGDAMGAGVFYIPCEEDRTLFMLKWCV